uniref:Uncharacterized protein n=1 Tax=Ananas comosus var. bracteatus TaxID=296719 RepID=A0A6V7NY64_ANACO|nr:unnamed protein product [Ananas comosus var. bracteatus]
MDCDPAEEIGIDAEGGADGVEEGCSSLDWLKPEPCCSDLALSFLPLLWQWLRQGLRIPAPGFLLLEEEEVEEELCSEAIEPLREHELLPEKRISVSLSNVELRELSLKGCRLTLSKPVKSTREIANLESFVRLPTLET